MANLSNINGKFVVDTAGNIGVGTLLPRSDANTTNISIQSSGTARLFVNNTSASGKEYAIYSSANGDFGIFDYDAISARLVINSAGNATFAGALTGTTATFSSASSPILETVATSTNNSSLRLRGSLSALHYWDIQHVHSDNDLTFGWSGSEKVRIDSSGNVGIGVTPPSTVLLDLKEPDAGSDLIIGLTAGTGARAQIRSEAQSNDTKAELGFYTVTGSSTSEAMRINQYGNVGIGKSQSGNAVLTVKSPAGGNTGIILIEGDTTDDGWGVYATTANKYIITRFTGGSYSDKFTILEGGNVGIGTSGPLAKLTVKTAGSAQVETGLRLINPYGFGLAGTGTKLVFAQDRSDSENYEMASIQSRQGAGGTSIFGDLSFYTRNSALTEKMRITHAGGISFGTTGTAYGTSGQVLISNGNTSPTWGSATSVSEDNYWKIDDGLNFHLAFKEGSGTTVADLGGGRNNFTGTATWTETGKFGYALDFNGTNQNLGGAGPSSNVTTFSAWINNDGGGGIQNIVSGTYIMAYVSIYSNRFNIYDGIGWRDAGAIPLNEWVHVAFSYDASGNSGGLQKMYINGVLGYSATAVGYTGVSNYISHVGVFSGAIRYFNGEITNIQTWDRILGDSEILSLYNQYSGNGGNVSEASLWTVKAIQSGVVVNGTITLSDLTHTYTYDTPHALYISGGFTTTPDTVGQTYSAHMSVYVDGNLVALVDQHDTPPEWWRQGFAFMTPNYTSGQHTITVTGTNQNGNFNVISSAAYSQIVYRIIPL
jgi:hypothetical protein